MLDPYRMVVVNIILSFIVLMGIFIYRFIYPKKKINLLILLIIISLLPLFSMLRAGTYQSGDLSLHAIRTMSFSQILFQEHIIPRWTPEFYAGFGDPYFSFAYFLPYLLGSIFHFMGLSFLASLKLLMAISFVLSGVFMYLFVKDDLGEKAAFTAGIFYLFAPFHLVNMHFQVTIAMTLSYMFLPINLLLTKKIILNPKPKWLISFSISEILFILTHQVISLIFLPINILYALYLVKDKNQKVNKLLKFFTSLFFGLLLSAFYWLPILIESKYTQDALGKHDILFPSLIDLMYSPWRYGLLFQGPMGELSYIIGYTQIFVIILSLYLFFKKRFDKKTKNLFLFFIFITTILLFFILPISKPLWYTLPLLKEIQFSTRLLVPLSFSIAVLAGITVITINKKWYFILLCSLTIFYTILNWGNRTTISTINDDVLTRQFVIWPSLKTVGLEPASPIWANLNKNISNISRTQDAELLSGEADIKNTFRSSTRHEYVIDVNSDFARIRENTLYFPGWILKVNNNQSTFDYQSQDNMGIITFILNKGINKVELLFVDTPVRKIANFISFITAISLFTYFIKKLYLKKLS